MKKPTPVTLHGTHIRLEPLYVNHCDELFEAACDERIWEWNAHGIRTRDDLDTYIRTAVEEQSRGVSLPFAIIDKTAGTAIGSTRYGNIAAEHERLEIGWTWLNPSYWRTRANTECKYLLLKHAFETLGANRVEFKTDALNWRSRNAILRLGAKEEGILRAHMVTESGRRRDTVYYSILREEWPEIESRLAGWLNTRFDFTPW